MALSEGHFARKYIAEPVAFPTINSINMDEGAKIESGTNGTAPRNAHGWDGKLRIDKKATLTNPEALSDPEYSDEEAPLPEVIEADEGMFEGLVYGRDVFTERQICWRISKTMQMYAL